MPSKYECPKCGQAIYTTYPAGSPVECKACGATDDVPLGAKEVPLSEAIQYFAIAPIVLVTKMTDTENGNSTGIPKLQKPILKDDNSIKATSVAVEAIAEAEEKRQKEYPPNRVRFAQIGCGSILLILILAALGCQWCRSYNGLILLVIVFILAIIGDHILKTNTK